SNSSKLPTFPAKKSHKVGGEVAELGRCRAVIREQPELVLHRFTDRYAPRERRRKPLPAKPLQRRDAFHALAQVAEVRSGLQALSQFSLGTHRCSPGRRSGCA